MTFKRIRSYYLQNKLFKLSVKLGIKIAIPPYCNFESQSLNLFSVNKDLQDKNQNPNIDTYHTQIFSLKGTIFQKGEYGKFRTKMFFRCISKHS